MCTSTLECPSKDIVRHLNVWIFQRIEVHILISFILSHIVQVLCIYVQFDTSIYSFFFHFLSTTSGFKVDRFRQNYGFSLPCAIPSQSIYSVVCQTNGGIWFSVWKCWFKVDFWLKFVVNRFLDVDLCVHASGDSLTPAHNHNHSHN